MSLRSSNQQPPVIYVKFDRLQPRIEPVTYDLSPARGTARPCHGQTRLGIKFESTAPEADALPLGHLSF